MRSDWTDEIAQRLLKPFPPEEIDLKDGLSYVDARAVMRRLDEAVGPGGWSFSWECVEATAEHVAVMGCLTVLDVQRCDAGEAHANKSARVPEELVKFAVSDALKRCGVQFGIGRFLYEMGKSTGGRVSEGQIAAAAKKTGFKQEAVVIKQAAPSVSDLPPKTAQQMKWETKHTPNCDVCQKELIAQELQGCIEHPDWFDNHLFCYEHAKAYRLDKKARESLDKSGVKVS